MRRVNDEEENNIKVMRMNVERQKKLWSQSQYKRSWTWSKRHTHTQRKRNMMRIERDVTKKVIIWLADGCKSFQGKNASMDCNIDLLQNYSKWLRDRIVCMCKVVARDKRLRKKKPIMRFRFDLTFSCDNTMHLIWLGFGSPTKLGENGYTHMYVR